MRFKQISSLLLALLLSLGTSESLVAKQPSRAQSQSVAAAKKNTVKKRVAKKKAQTSTKKAVRTESNSTKAGYGVKGAKLQPTKVSNKTYRYKEKGKVHHTIDRESSRQYGQVGTASYYGGMFHGRKTASGDVFNENGFTAAHKTLALGSYALVTNLRNGRKVIVKINDRGPFSKDRIIDLSKGAAREIGMLSAGTAQVRVEAMQVDSQGYISGKAAQSLYELAQKEGLPLRVRYTNGDLSIKADGNGAEYSEKKPKQAVKKQGKSTKKALKAKKKSKKTLSKPKKQSKKAKKTTLKKSKKVVKQKIKTKRTKKRA